MGRHLRLMQRLDQGAVAVEFALLAPLLILLVIGIISFGFVFSQNLALNNASRDAARFAVVKQIDGTTATRTCWDALARARQNSQGIGLRSDQVGVTVSVGGASVCSIAAGVALPTPRPASAPWNKVPCEGTTSGVNDRLSVTSTYNSHLPAPFIGRTQFTLNATSSFRCEFR